MSARPSFWKCLAAAFSARPFGMFVPPNWIALSAIGLLGLRNPGFWLIGAGLELAYLFSLATNKKFQDWVARRGSAGSDKAFQEKQDALIARLSDTDQARYVAFVSRCRTILDQFSQLDSSGAAAQVQAEGLGKLTWVYLRLLLARRAMLRVLKDPSTSETEELQVRLDRVKARLDEKTMDEDLRKSLGSQAEILAQRVNQRFLHLEDDHPDHLFGIIGLVEQVGEVGSDDVTGAAENAHPGYSGGVRGKRRGRRAANAFNLGLEPRGARSDWAQVELGIGLGRNTLAAGGLGTAIGGCLGFRPKRGKRVMSHLAGHSADQASCAEVPCDWATCGETWS